MKKRSFPEELMFLKNRKAIQNTSTAPMKDKLVIITGATSGVGYEAAKRLAEAGAHLVMVSRNPVKAEAVRFEIESKYSVRVDCITADFSNLAEVRSAADSIIKRYQRIDVLINSAGMHSTKKIRTKDGFELIFCVNHLASFLFTKLLIPHLIQSAPARILQINSEGHRFNGLNPNDLNWNKRLYTGLRGYGASKTAQLLTLWEMADELEGSGVTINAMHPGDVRTNIGQNNGFLYRVFTKLFTARFLKNPVISGEAIYYLVADAKMEGISGKFFHLTIEEKPAKHALDRNLGKIIYHKSIEMTRLKTD